MIEIYRTFTLPPDFGQVPETSFDAGRRDIPLGAARRYGIWDSRARRIMQATWKTTTMVDTRTLREFLEENQGRANPFYIPSWTPDFRVRDPASTGDTDLIIIVGTDLQNELSPEKLDEFGTVAWFYSRRKEMHISRVLSATNNLDGSTDIELEVPLGFDVDNTTFSGFCIFARQTQDSLEAHMMAPDAMEVQLAVEEARHTLETTETLPITGNADQYSFPAINEVSRNPLTPSEPLQPDKVAVDGPETYGGSQTFPHQQPWNMEITDTGVRMQEDGGAWQDSDLYPARPEGDHITGAFTVGGLEVIAAGLFNGNCEIRYFDAMEVAQTVTFEGFAPQAINTWAVDASVTAGNADVVVVYLRKGEAKLFARFSREDYAIEYKLTDSPLNPLYLTDIDAESDTLRVHGLDTTHNKTIWKAEIVPVPNLLRGSTTMTGSVSGVYEPTIKDAPSMAAGVGMTGSVEGEYESILREPDPIQEGGEFVGEIQGEYVETILQPQNFNEGMTLTGELIAEYSLVVKPTPGLTNNEVGMTAEISGTYETDP